jgi:hypothetical protein
VGGGWRRPQQVNVRVVSGKAFVKPASAATAIDVKAQLKQSLSGPEIA